jgi:pyrroloquinoline quinone (PQQ) biosynthesis protein C
MAFSLIAQSAKCDVSGLNALLTMMAVHKTGDEGGIKKWLRLGEAVGLTSEEMLHFSHL